MEIRLARQGRHVAVVTVDNQPRLNAMTRPMLSKLGRLWDELERDGDCRCIILTGAGQRAFTVGADVTGDLSAVPAQDDAGSAGAREVAARPRPPRRAATAAGAGFGGRPDLAGRFAEVALIVPRRRTLEAEQPPGCPGGWFRNWLRGLDLQNATRSRQPTGLTLFGRDLPSASALGPTPSPSTSASHAVPPAAHESHQSAGPVAQAWPAGRCLPHDHLTCPD
jgi:hypothetical protein